MAMRQSRRTISINRDRFKRATEFAASQGVSLSMLTEYALEQLQSGTGLNGLDDFVSRRHLETVAARIVAARIGGLIGRRQVVDWKAICEKAANAAPWPHPVTIEPTESASVRAARHRRETGCSFAEAARVHGISRQAAYNGERELRAAEARPEAPDDQPVAEVA